MIELKVGVRNPVFAKIDDDMWNKVKDFKWIVVMNKRGDRPMPKGDRFISSPDGKKIRIQIQLAQLVLGEESKNKVIIFKNGDSLDCQRENLSCESRSGLSRSTFVLKNSSEQKNKSCAKHPYKSDFKMDTNEAIGKMKIKVKANEEKIKESQSFDEPVFLDVSQVNQIDTTQERSISSIKEVVSILTEQFGLFKLVPDNSMPEIGRATVLMTSIDGSAYFLILNQEENTMVLHKNKINNKHGIKLYIPKTEAKLLEIFSTVLCM
jgi:hypothetical protein